jgi:hypothetical protein
MIQVTRIGTNWVFFFFFGGTKGKTNSIAEQVEFFEALWEFILNWYKGQRTKK